MKGLKFFGVCMLKGFLLIMLAVTGFSAMASIGGETGWQVVVSVEVLIVTMFLMGALSNFMEWCSHVEKE